MSDLAECMSVKANEAKALDQRSSATSAAQGVQSMVQRSLQGKAMAQGVNDSQNQAYTQDTMTGAKLQDIAAARAAALEAHSSGDSRQVGM